MRHTKIQRGFNLIDLMIGMAIGLFGMLAVAVVFRDFGQNRNTQAQTSESQTNGTLALYLIERDLGQAGYGMMSLQNCQYINFYNASATTAPATTANYNTPYTVSGSAPYAASANLPGTSNTALTTLPVLIRDGGAFSDSIEIQYGNSTSGVTGSAINAAPVTYPGAYTVKSNIGFALGDLIVADVNNICTLMQVNPAPAPTVDHQQGGGYPFNTNTPQGGSGWNSVTTADLSATPPAYLANLGGFVSRRYSANQIAGTSTYALSLSDVMDGSPASTVVDGIVYLKAQYGLAATSTSTVVTSWVDGTTNIDNTNANRVIAVRIGVLARSPLYEKDSVSDGIGVHAPKTYTLLPAIDASSMTDPSLDCATSTSSTSMEVRCTIPNPNPNPLNPSSVGTHYRYRAYSTVIPLKNVIWTR